MNVVMDLNVNDSNLSDRIKLKLRLAPVMADVNLYQKPLESNLRVIGVGTFGVVFELPGTSLAIKKTLHGPGVAHKLIDEFNYGMDIHQAIHFKAAGIFKGQSELEGLVVPRVPSYMKCFGSIRNDGSHSWWQMNGEKFPKVQGYEKPGPVFYFERIPALPKDIRTNLIKSYFAPASVAAALQNPDNNDALIRPYLGHSWKDLTPDQQKESRNTLRNFPLYVDELADLGINPEIIAKDMALAVAAAHWEVSIDLLDSEFVIASRPHYSQDLKTFLDASTTVVDKGMNYGKDAIDIVPLEETIESSSTHNSVTQLWLVDFDKCARFTIEEQSVTEDIANLVQRTRANDPYYPNAIPASKLEAQVWIAFRDTYILASRALLKVQLQKFNEMGRMAGMPDVPVEKETVYLDRPKQVMKEWHRQDKMAMDPKEYERRKEMSLKEGRLQKAE